MLPLISTPLCDRIFSGELTAYLLKPCDDPTQSKSLPFPVMLHMSAQNTGLQVSQAPTTI